MKLASSVFTDTRSLRSALKGLSSEDLLALNAEIEAIALERIEEEEAARVRAHERQQVIADIKELLALERITPEELLAFSKGRTSASKRSR
ncbi:H-NS family histone-like protein [Aeromonas hydrophila]|uniref:H-NS family histone-like protein n=1 Tax=Aeromonas hydrophila TaxID=644 RepID=UPI003985DEA3